MNIDRKEIRKIIWSYFKGNNSTQMNGVLRDVRTKIGIDEFDKKFLIVYEEVFSLSNKGLIMFVNPTREGPNQAFPFIEVTEYGKRCFGAETLISFDPDRYIDKVKEMVSGIDDITLKYLNESINTFNREAPISATIALGVASEQLMLLLIEAHLESIKSMNEKSNLINKTKGKFIETQYKEFRKSLDTHKSNIAEDVLKDIDVWLDGTFRFIKMLRNEQGHPTDIEADKDTTYAYLQTFPHYAKRVFNLIEWLRGHKNSL